MIKWLVFASAGLFIPNSRRGDGRQRFPVLQFFHYLFDGATQLLVFTIPFPDRVIVYFNIGCYAVILNDPLAGLRVVACKERNANVCPVHVGKRAADAHNASPCARPDEFPQA